MEFEKIEGSRVKFTFNVTKDDFEKALDEAFVKVNKNVAIKGFRKGAAPRSVYEKHYGVESLFQDALDVILQNKVNEVVSDKEITEKLVLLGQFSADVDKEFGRGKDFKVYLFIDVQPEFELPKYKDVKVDAKKVEVTDEEVNQEIKYVVSKDIVKAEKVSGVIANGDIVKFDYVGSVDGVEFEGGKQDDAELEIGSHHFIPGFEEAMVGLKVGDKKDIEVTFPENYGAENLAGKKAVFKLNIKEVKEQVLPEFTDEYVKGLKIEGVNTYAELKENKKKEIEARKDRAEDDRIANEICKKLVDLTTVEVPQTLVTERVNSFKGQYEAQAKAYGISLEQLLMFQGLTLEQFNDQIEKNAYEQAKFNLVASKVMEVEKLVPTKEEVEAYAEEQAKNLGKTKDELLAANLQRYFSEISYKKLIDFLKANVVIA